MLVGDTGSLRGDLRLVLHTKLKLVRTPRGRSLVRALHGEALTPGVLEISRRMRVREAELYASVPPSDGLTFVPAVRYPPHERRVEIAVDLGAGEASATVLGSDRTHEYISENADYRS